MPLLIAFLLFAPFTSAHRNNGDLKHGFLSVRSDMQPQVVAQTLSKVEHGWREQAVSLAKCNTSSTTNCSGGVPEQFTKSCSTIVNAIVRASSGDRSVVKDYLGDVCLEPSLQGWQRECCHGLSLAVFDGMTADVYSNREHLDSTGICGTFWLRFSAKEVSRVEQELKEQAVVVAAQKKAEEAQIKVAEEAAKKEAERQAALEAERVAAEKAADERRRKQLEYREEAERVERQADQVSDETDRRMQEAQALVNDTSRIFSLAGNQHTAAMQAVGSGLLVAKPEEPASSNATEVARNASQAATNATQAGANTTQATTNATHAAVGSVMEAALNTTEISKPNATGVSMNASTTADVKPHNTSFSNLTAAGVAIGTQGMNSTNISKTA